MTKSARLTALALLFLPVLAACGKTAATAAPTLQALYTSRLSLSDVTPATGDAQNWWQAAPTFDVRPLNSATREDADAGGLTTRFTHMGTAEELTVNYQVWSSTAIATRLIDFEETVLGTSLTGPKAGDKSLYYNRKLQAGAAQYNNEAFVRLGQTIITIIWSHREGYANPNAFGKIAVKAAGRLKDVLSGKVNPSPVARVSDPLLLAPAGQLVTLLGATRLPLEVLAQMLGESAPTGLVDEFHKHGSTDFVFGDYALNVDTRMEVVTAGITFAGSTDGQAWINSYFAGLLNSSGEFGQYVTGLGQYLFAFGSGSRAIVIFCKSSVDLEEAGRSCETPMNLLVAGWHPLLSSA